MKTVKSLLHFCLYGLIYVCVAAQVLQVRGCWHAVHAGRDKSVASDWPSLNKQRHYSLKLSIQLLCNTWSYSHTVPPVHRLEHRLRSVLIRLLFGPMTRQRLLSFIAIQYILYMQYLYKKVVHLLLPHLNANYSAQQNFSQLYFSDVWQ